MPGLPRKSTKNQFTKLLKKSGKSKTNTESGATAVTKNISTVERKILKYKQFINEMNLNDFLPPGMNIKDFEIGENGDHLSFYSKKLNIFKPVEIKLLRNLYDIMRDRHEPEDFIEDDEDDIEAGTVCEMVATPAEIYIDYIGHTYYSINDPEDFIENVDFVFI